MEGQQLPLDIQLNTNSEEKGAVECLGMTFESDEERRAYFIEKLREKLQDPEFRQIEGFPIGEDEDILVLSDPPYYTACPNPFIEDFINYWDQEKDNNSSSETDEYHREPFAADVSEGKNDPIYNAHSYHTKVPHKAIMRYILHYTEPGDIVFDGFCGTGMTGVAAQLCGDKATVESLGYKVQADGTILDDNGKAFSKLGARPAILNDLSPAATFIAYNYNTPVDVVEFEKEAKRILAKVEKECGWMYLTLHNSNPEQIEKAASLLKESNNPQIDIQNIGLPFGRINYTVWSDVFTCPECADEVVFWDAAIDKLAGKVFDEFPCPHCNTQLTKRNMERAWVTRFDTVINQTVKQAKQKPVLVNYNIGKKRFEKVPDIYDLLLIEIIENSLPTYYIPTDTMMHVQPGNPWGDEWRPGRAFEYIYHLFFQRGALIASTVLNGFYRGEYYNLPTIALSITGILPNLSRMYRWRSNGKGGTVSGTFYLPSTPQEMNAIEQLKSKIKTLSEALCISKSNCASVSTQSSNKFNLLESSVDYIFTDPPFGSNIAYSELNFPAESWLRVFTNTKPEAIENKSQGKGLTEYQELMTSCFEEYYQCLKPGRWITVEFHNSKNSVWTSIQEAMQHVGFVIADVRTLDKKQGSFKQVNSSNATKQDLIISAYKPTTNFEEQFKLEAGTEEACWEFVRTHLQKLSVFVAKDGKAETIAERQNYLLFDRMVAFHIQRGFTVPLSASEFYAGLTQRFTERDEMYFLHEQVAEYDKKRMTVKEILQLELVVSNEETAVQWLKQQLTKKPQTFQEIHPQFMLSKAVWSKVEKPLELLKILEQNFLRYEGKGAIPKQIVSWLKQSSIHRDKICKIEGNLPPDAIGLETDDPKILSSLQSTHRTTNAR
ncbi:DNA methyltransferase [Nostoc sp.]|uniref:DNA methyltransferase n=1 Tax=Nostoc sp. TaxID=1180 RepID=UPI002FF86D89